MRITAFIGAGATIQIGGPTTEQLTEVVKLQEQWVGDPTKLSDKVPAIRAIAEALDHSYCPEPTKCPTHANCPNRANFEDIFNAIEALTSLQTGQRTDTAKPFKPALGAFVTPNAAAAYSDITLQCAWKDIRDKVADYVVNYMNRFDPMGVHQWFGGFWKAATSICP